MNKLLILTRTNWDEAPRARHRVASSLSKSNLVYFFEANQMKLKFGLRTHKYDNNLQIIKPCFPLSLKYRVLPFFNELFQLIYLMLLRKKFGKDIPVIVFDHTLYLSSWFFKNVIYYCNDDFDDKRLLIGNYFRFSENLLSKSSTFIIVTSNYLKHKFNRYFRKVYEIKLGTVKTPISILSTNSHSNSVTKIALLGFLNSRNNISLLKDLIKHNQFEIHVFGDISKDLIDVLDSPNVIKHGTVVYDELQKRLSKCDLGIAPYDLKIINKGVTPNKLWEYLSVGLPVVISEIPNIKFWKFPKHFIYVAKNNEDFISLIKMAKRHNTDELILERYKFSQNNTWDDRMEQIKSIAQNYSILIT